MTTITIKQYQFGLSDPYDEGHELTLAEAQALNALRAENIRNNGARALERLQGRAGTKGELMTSHELEEFRKVILRLDRDYVFQRRRDPQAIVRTGTIDAECRLVAIERVERQMRSLGIEMGPSEFEAAVETMASDRATLDVARERLQAKIKASQEFMEGLL